MQILFIFGFQRSGTSILSSVIGELKESQHYPETDAEINSDISKEAGQTIRLKNLSEVQDIFNNVDPAKKLIVAKPLVESQNAHTILDFFDDASAFWSYRSYLDVVSSHIKKWGTHKPEDYFRTILNNNNANWRSENLTDNCKNLFSKFYNPQMPFPDVVALFWLIRNQLYFDQRLNQNNRIQLVNYERLVEEENYLQMKLDNMNLPIHVVQRNHKFNNNSLNKGSDIVLSDSIENECKKMYEKLLETEEKQNNNKT